MEMSPQFCSMSILPAPSSQASEPCLTGAFGLWCPPAPSVANRVSHNLNEIEIGYYVKIGDYRNIVILRHFSSKRHYEKAGLFFEIEM